MTPPPVLRKSTKVSRLSFRVWAGRSGHETKVIYRHIIMYCLLCSTQGRLCTTLMFVTCLSGYETLALVVVMKNSEVKNPRRIHAIGWLSQRHYNVLAIEHT